MKFISLFILFGLVYQTVSFDIKPFDSAALLGLFTHSSGSPSNTLRLDQSLPVLGEDTEIAKRITVSAFFEEQCAMQCLKNLPCVRYTYQSQKCQIFLKADYRRQQKFDKNQTSVIENNLNCNLETCSEGLFCSSTSGCFCPLSTASTGSETCSNDVSYELSEWSEWSACSAVCSEGYQTRTKSCNKVYKDASGKLLKKEKISNIDWLCPNTVKSETITCKANGCALYTEWSDWSSCSKICGGYSTRTRACLPGKACDEKYLNQFKSCGLSGCNATIIKLTRTDASVTSVIKRGILKLSNTNFNRDIRLFTLTNDANALSSIGSVACKEFNFDNLNNVVASPANLRPQYSSDSEYLDFVNSQSINGLLCNGDESSVKECKASSNATVSTPLFELNIECLFNGYWATWDSWSDCSVTCGAGAKRRYRVCNDPPASVAELPSGANGTSCNEANNKQLSTCIMPRCESQINI